MARPKSQPPRTASSLPRPARRGSILFPTFAGLAALGLLAWGGAVALYSASVPSPKAPAPAKSRLDPGPLTNQELAVALTRFGLAAEPLAAAGCTAQDIAAIVGNGRDHLEEHIQDLRTADQAWSEAKGSLENLRKLVQGGKRENLQAYQTAVTAFAAADTAREAVIGGIVEAAVSGLDPGKRTVVATIRANARWDLPTRFQAANRSEADWVHLRNALANERISVAQNVSPDPTEQLFIQSQSGGAVATATAYLNEIQSLRAAWNAAVFP